LEDVQELVRFPRRQKEVERHIVGEANKTVEKVEKPLVRGVIRGKGLDSKKHENVLSAIEARLGGSTPFLTEEERKRRGDAMKRHIQWEEEAIRTYQELLESSQDEKLRLLIRYSLEDEKRHHSLLKRIDKIVVESETLKEEDLMYMVWFETLFHGSPGG